VEITSFVPPSLNSRATCIVIPVGRTIVRVFRTCVLVSMSVWCAVRVAYTCVGPRYAYSCKRVQDSCAEEEYRERDSPCEVKLYLPTVAVAAAAAAAAAVAVATYRMWLSFLLSTKRNTQRCVLIPSATLPIRVPRILSRFVSRRIPRSRKYGNARICTRESLKNGPRPISFRYQKLRYVPKILVIGVSSILGKRRVSPEASRKRHA